MPDSKSRVLTAAEVRDVVWGGNAEVQKLFKEHFGDELERAIQVLGDGYSKFQQLQNSVALDERTATVQMFIHVAIASVIASLHHLVSGYPIAAGHMMRHYTEAIAMALMCSDEATGVYKKYAAHRGTFPVHKSPQMLRQRSIRNALAKSIGFDEAAWEQVLAISQLYDTLSHASALALGFHMLFTEEGGLVVGSEFDPAKIDEYGSDVIRRRSAAESLAHIVPLIMDALPHKK